MSLTVRDKRFPSATGVCDIAARVWIPDEIRGAVQIMHGMAEYLDRYTDFAAFLAQNGYLVYGLDMAGHGKSHRTNEPYGYFGETDGWDKLIADMKTLHDLVMKDYPAIPAVLLGHSMGSFLARSYAARHGEDFQGFIFSGTAGKNPLLPVAKLIIKSELKKGKAHEPNEKLDKLSFGSHNKQFKPARTAFDWLSRDEASVDRYVADPLCGFPFTTLGFRDLMTGLGEISEKSWAAKVPNQPILLLSGANDPVGGNGAGVKQVYHALTASGHKDVCLKLYEGGRHEMLNETNKDEVYRDLLLFLETVCAMGEQA